MAVAVLRSMNAEVEEGMTDGTYRKPVPNSVGYNEATLRARRNLDPAYYGNMGFLPPEARHLPDGTQ